MTTYVLAGGCFWCLEAVFLRLSGVKSVQNGYAGGSEEDATFGKVSTGTTGHAEAVQITFDESIIPGKTILDIFFLIHDPTTKDRQGNDVGPQYRSAMFYADDAQKAEFTVALERAKTHWGDSIVTEISPLEKFYNAEPEHNDYFNNNPANPYCSFVISPKIAKARASYATWFIAE